MDFEELSLCDIPQEILEGWVWPRLNLRSVQALACTGRWGRDMVTYAEAWFERCSGRRWGQQCCRLSWRHRRLWASYYFERVAAEKREPYILVLDGKGALVLKMQGDVVLQAKGSLAACASPDGRFIAFDAMSGVDETTGALVPARWDQGRITVLDMVTREHWVFKSFGSVVYCYWDPSSTRLTWISTGEGDDGLGFSVADCSGQEPVVAQAGASGAPFFWHICPSDTSLAVAHISNDLWCLRFEAGQVAAQRLFSLQFSLFQTPQVSPDFHVLFAWPVSDRVSALMCVPLAAMPDQNGLSHQLDEVVSSSTALQDPRVLCILAGSMIRFQLTPDGKRVYCGSHSEAVLTDLWEIDMARRTRKALPLSEKDALVSFFLSPDSSMILFLGLSFEHRALQWTVYDCASGVARKSQAVHPTQRMVNNRIPFNSAYALSHNPWHKNSSCFVYSDGTDGIKVQDVVRTPTQPLILPPPRSVSTIESGTAWFA